MQFETALVCTQCLRCSNEVTITNRWTPGGMNDYGGYVLECSTCHKPFAFRLGRDINDSSVDTGATVLATWDEELNNKAEVLAKFGLS